MQSADTGPRTRRWGLLLGSSRPELVAALVVLTLGSQVQAADPVPPTVENPFGDARATPNRVDLRPGAENLRPPLDPPYPKTPRFEELDAFEGPAPVPAPGDDHRDELPEGLAQVGGMIVPEAMLHGADMAPPRSFVQAGGARPQADNRTVEEICAFPDEVPAGFYDREPRPGEERPRFHTIFLNFNGGVLSNGGENSAEDRSTIARTGHPYPVYTGGETRAIAVGQAIQADFERYAVRVVYRERPSKTLPYTMVMMGGSYSDTTSGPAGGVAPLDCEDVGQRNVCYVFMNQQSATEQANVASQEIGHTIGLGHTRGRDSVMALGYAPTNGGDLGFSNECEPILGVSDQGASCIGINRCHCGVPDLQHDVNTLFAGFAAAGVDMVEPTIEVTAPADGTVFTVGETVTVELAPWDDVGGFGWKLVVIDEATDDVIVDQVDYSRQLVFELEFPVGKYTIRGEIVDHADHVARHEIHIEVAMAAESGSETGDTAASEGGDESGLEGGSESESGGDEDDRGASGNEAETDDGCGCTMRGPGRPTLALLLLGGLAGVRRRRATHDRRRRPSHDGRP